jgi:hypothetical protein
LALCIKRESKGNKFLSQKGLSENKSVFTKHWFSEIRLFCNGTEFRRKSYMNLHTGVLFVTSILSFILEINKLLLKLYRNPGLINRNMKTVEIFKTDVRDEKNACEIIKFLLVQYNTVYKINFDLEDEDNILRVEANRTEIKIRDIIQTVVGLGYRCERIK